jgi:radical SAM protein with 4Fe4S-binding SPASM domain
VAASGIKIIRFTGGEPMLRSDLFVLMRYAKDKKLEVRLNTNASLVNNDNVGRFRGILDNVLIPIEGWSSRKEEEITGHRNALDMKIKAVKLFKKAGIPVVRVGTVATGENIVDLDKLAKLILSLPIDEWELYRPIFFRGSVQSITNEDVDRLIRKIVELYLKTGKRAKIANALPFCATDKPHIVSAFSSGALFDDGHNRLVVDPRGFMKPHYFMDKNIGDPLSILAAWNHPFMKKMRDLKFLPQECGDCVFKYKCRGGSRSEAKMAYGRYDSPDPLARMNFKSQ